MSHLHPVAPPPPGTPLQLRLLGPAAWCRGDGTWHPLAGKDALLLACLALDGLQSRARLAALLWAGVPASRANANLRQRLFRLKQQGAALFDETDTGLRLACAVACDLAADSATVPDPSALLLAGQDAAADDACLQQWLHDARLRWQALLPERLARHATQCEARGELAAAIAACEALLSFDPLLEQGWRRLMRLHHRRGDRTAAVNAFERCERTLRDELGVTPGPETRALLQDVEQLAPLPGPSSRVPLPPGLLRPPRLVGRARPWQQLEAAWQQAQVFVITADAGVGKSRLLGDFAASRPHVVLESARPGDEAVPYGVLVRLLRAMWRVLPPARPGDVPHANLGLADPRTRTELARLLPELGPPPAAPGLEVLLHGAVEQLLQAAATAGVEGVLIDDLQHADAASRTLLQRVIASSALRWGFASRPDPSTARSDAKDWHDWLGSSARLCVLRLPGLDEAELRDLLRSVGVPRFDNDAVAVALARHCGGNPLFLLETLKHMLTEGAPAPPGDPGRLPLPPSVETVLSRRLASLSPSALTLARVAAVAGPDFGIDVAADVMHRPMLELADALAELEQAQILGAGGFANESVFDTTLRGVPAVLGAGLHAAVAHSLERRGAPPARVAQHHARAGTWAAAARAARQAAAQALRLGRTGERLSHLRQAAAWADADHDAAGAFDARVACVDAVMASEGLAAASELCRDLLPQARGADQRRALRLAQASIAVAGYDATLAMAAATAALADAGPGSDDDLRCRMLLASGLALAGQTDQALAQLQPLHRPLLALDGAADAAELWSQFALVQYRAGRIEDCVAALERQRRLAARSGQVETEVAALASLSGQLNALGDADRALALACEAVQLYERMGAASSAVISRMGAAVVLLGLDRLDEAGAELDMVLAFTRRTAAGSDLHLAAEDLLATLHLRRGHADAALAALSTGPNAGDSLSSTRRLSRLALHALAARQHGDRRAEHARWLDLRAVDGSGADLSMQLRCRAESTVVLTDDDALVELQGLQDQAEAARLPACEAVVRVLRLQRHLQAGRSLLAAQEARALLALQPRSRHRYVDQAALQRACALALDGRQDPPCAPPKASDGGLSSTPLPVPPSISLGTTGADAG